MGSPHCKAKLAPPRLKLWPEYLSGGIPNADKQALSFRINNAWVRTDNNPSGLLYLNSGAGVGLPEHSLQNPRREVEGQKGELLIFGKGTCKVRSRYWITFDHRMANTTPWGVNSTSWTQRCLDGSNNSGDWISKLDFLKKEKNPTRQAASELYIMDTKMFGWVK